MSLKLSKLDKQIFETIRTQFFVFVKIITQLVKFLIQNEFHIDNLLTNNRIMPQQSQFHQCTCNAVAQKVFARKS